MTDALRIIGNIGNIGNIGRLDGKIEKRHEQASEREVETLCLRKRNQLERDTG